MHLKATEFFIKFLIFNQNKMRPLTLAIIALIQTASAGHFKQKFAAQLDCDCTPAPPPPPCAAVIQDADAGDLQINCGQIDSKGFGQITAKSKG